jgi:lipoyl-dependent peroxiredoxin
LIPAAHAGCLRWRSRTGLAQAGTPAEELTTSATVTFQPGEGITKITLTVRGRGVGIDESSFREAAETAKEACPVSKALAGVPEITLDARLDS